MPTTKKVTKKPTLKYQSNPFSLSFDKFGQFFEKNLGWAILLIIAPLLGLFFQMLAAVVDTTSSNVQAHAGNAHNAANNPEVFGLVAFILLILGIVFFAVLIVVFTAVNVFISGIFAYVALENDAGRTARFGAAIDAVVGRFWRLFQAQLLAIVKILAWSLLFIIPGIVAAFRYALLPYVIMDESASEKGVKTSHERIKALVNGRKREVFGVATVAAIIPIVGGINQLVGNAALYRQLQASHDQKLEKPPIHWLNYFGFILIGLYILLIIFIASLAMLAYYSQPH